MPLFQGDTVFDFGLAREIPSNKEEDYQMTQMVGSPRYIAPEVALGQAYNKSCDVYSFSLIRRSGAMDLLVSDRA